VPVVTSSTFSRNASERSEITDIRRSSSWIVPGARVGVKVFGTDLAEMEGLSREIERVLKTVGGTSSAYAERIIGGYYLEITPNRDTLARYGLMVGDV
jgi:Cu/Ag efflux pump CusA